MDAHSIARPRRLGFISGAVLTLLLILGIVIFEGTGTGATGSPTTTEPQTAAQEQATDLSVADVAEQANPAVVTVVNYQPVSDPFSRNGSTDDPQAVGAGSGFIIDEEGHVVTNYHVIEGATEVTVELYDGTEVDATVVGSDPFQDVAVLQLDLSDGQTVPGVLSFADSDSVRAGDQVVAIGTPLGEFTNTVSEGIVGAVDRSLDTDWGYRLPNLLQHDAELSPGNSGGPLLNLQGQVIGMNVAKLTGTSLGGPTADGLGFAIDSNAIKEIADQIIANGKSTRPYMGIESQPVEGGQVVTTVEDDTPASEAGLQPGDVITAVDGTEIDEENPFLNQVIFDHQPGDNITLTVDRNGDEQEIDLTLGERPAETQ